MSGFGLGASALGATNTSSASIDTSTPFVAAADGNLPLLQQALRDLKMSVNQADENGYTLLHASASYSQLPVMQWLLEQKVDVQAVDQEGDSALHYASTVDACRLLLQTGIRVDLRNNEGHTALESKEHELLQEQEDEDEYDENDPDIVALKAVIQFLSSH